MCAAAGKGDVKQIQAMLAHGADVNECDHDHRSPLHLAASEGHLAACRLLLETGANPNARDRSGATPLTHAILYGHDDVAELLHVKHATLGLNRTDQAYHLLNAASIGDAESVARWCRFGVSPDISDYDCRTAGHIAACEGHKDVLQALQNAGARFDLRDRWGVTAEVEMKRRKELHRSHTDPEPLHERCLSELDTDGPVSGVRNSRLVHGTGPRQSVL